MRDDDGGSKLPGRVDVCGVLLDDRVRVVAGIVQLFNGFEVSPVCEVSVSCCTCEDGR